MNNLINEKLSTKDFIDKFLYIWRKNRDRFAVNCEPNTASKEFAKWMDKIFSHYEDFEPEVQKNKQYGAEWLKDSVGNILIQIQKEYNFNENVDYHLLILTNSRNTISF